MTLWPPRRVRPSLLDAALAACLVVAAVVTALQYPWSLNTFLALLVSSLSAAALAWRSIAPGFMTVGFACGLFALAAIDQGPTATWAFAGLIVASFSAAANLPSRWMPYGVLVLFGAALTYHASVDDNSVAGTVVAPLVIVGAPAAAGILLRRARLQASMLATLTRELANEREQTRQASALAERARVARELHDVIAHTVGVMVVQAGAAEKLLNPADPAVEPVREIRRTGQQAMAELRRVLGILRTDDDPSAVPQPGIPELRELLSRAASRGEVRANLDIDAELPAGVALTVYRCVQEALTNARRHAPGSSIVVGVSTSCERLSLTVTNDLTEAPAGGPAGYGLVGLAERASLYGGTFRAGPNAEGTDWSVELELPVSGLALADSTP